MSVYVALMYAVSWDHTVNSIYLNQICETYYILLS